MRALISCLPAMLLFAGLAFAAAGSNTGLVPAETDSGGPDPYGYTWRDSNDPGGPVYAWKDISSMGTQVVGLGDDNFVGPFPIGFSFPFYWYNVTQYWISSNGYIMFSQPSSPPDYCNLNCFKEDLTFEEIGAQCRRWNNQDSLVVSFLNVPAFAVGGSHTFQLILDRLTGDIAFQYNAQSGSVSPTIGLESPGGYFSLDYLVNQSPAPFSAVTFYYPDVLPALDVTLTSRGPINLPASGGSFHFTVATQRNQTPQTPFVVWARIKNLPQGIYTAPTLGPVTINPPVGLLVSRLRTQNIPAGWSPGPYVYFGYANTSFSYPAIDSSAFPFRKLTTGSSPFVWDATCYGELFPGEEAISSQPSAFSLNGVTPNPFNSSTVISFQSPVTSRVNLRVYDLSGRLVATLLDGWTPAGTHGATFDGSGLASGLYFVRMEAGNYSAVGKMMMLK